MPEMNVRSDAVDVELFMAGATAEKNLLPNLLGGYAAQSKYSFSYPAGAALCKAGTLDLYYDAKKDTHEVAANCRQIGLADLRAWFGSFSSASLLCV